MPCVHLSSLASGAAILVFFSEMGLSPKMFVHLCFYIPDTCGKICHIQFYVARTANKRYADADKKRQEPKEVLLLSFKCLFACRRVLMQACMVALTV